LSGHEVRGQQMTAGARATTFQEILREKAHVGANRFGSDLLQDPIGIVVRSRSHNRRRCTAEDNHQTHARKRQQFPTPP
jgi:hypothetical protein